MDFVTRLKQYIDYTGLAVSQFADTAQIPRPTLSQILNGRNKKISNELIAKLHEGFPSLNIMWMLFGDGNMEISGNSVSAVTHSENRVLQNDLPSADRHDEEIDEYPPYASEMDLFTSAQNNGSDISANGSGGYGQRFARRDTGSGTERYRPQSGRQTPESSVQENNTAVRPEQMRNSGPQAVNFNPSMSLNPDSSKRVQSIMVFYTDNSFEIFTPSPLK